MPRWHAPQAPSRGAAPPRPPALALEAPSAAGTAFLVVRMSFLAATAAAALWALG